MKISELSDEQINDRIAVHIMGWHLGRSLPSSAWYWFDDDNILQDKQQDEGDIPGFDEYWNPVYDLNQCFDMEEALHKFDDWSAYPLILINNIGDDGYKLIHATARQKCIAALMIPREDK
jgi:hypothetical protein